MSDSLQLSDIGQRPRAPRLEELEPKFSPQAIAELETIKQQYPNLKACILPALWIAQREYDGWLPAEAIAEVAARLERSFAEVEGVATFYTMYNTQHKPGRHMIEVCTCLSCHQNGAYRLVDHLEELLGIGIGETTPDGEFTLHEVECLNACDRAPLVQIGDQYYGPLDAAKLDDLISKLRKSERPSAVQLAGEVVRVQLTPTDSE